MAEKLSTDIRREQIIKASMQIIGREGLKALTIRKVANMIDVVPANIYRHFKGKEDLIGEILLFIRESFENHFNRTDMANRGAVETLKGILLRQAESVQNEPAVFPRFFLSGDVFDSEATRLQVRQLFDSYLSRISRIVEIGQAQGEIRGDLDPGKTAVLYFGLFQPPTFFASLTNESTDIQSQIRHSFEIFRIGIEA